MAETEEANVMSLTVSLLSAYFANNTVPSSEVLALVEGTRRVLLGGTSVVEAAVGAASASPAGEGPTADETSATEIVTDPAHNPAVTIEQSLASRDHILSLIDGKPYKALKRHLSAHNLTPAQYRERYHLPSDYPMVAAGYSAARREVALKLGLGNKGKTLSAKTVTAPKASPTVEASAVSAPAKTEAATGKPKVVRKTPTKAKPVKSTPDSPKRKAAKSNPKSAAAAVSKPAPEAAPAPTNGAKATAEASAPPVSATKQRVKPAAKAPQAKGGKASPKTKAVGAAAKPKQNRASTAKPVEAAPDQLAPAASPASN